MDNIASNIIKYADENFPIGISFIDNNDWVGIRFWNYIRSEEKDVESTGIGIQSVRNMMQKMGGKCKVINQNGIFEIMLLFSNKPVPNKPGGNTVE